MYLSHYKDIYAVHGDSREKYNRIVLPVADAQLSNQSAAAKFERFVSAGSHRRPPDLFLYFLRYKGLYQNVLVFLPAGNRHHIR